MDKYNCEYWCRFIVICARRRRVISGLRRSELDAAATAIAMFQRGTIVESKNASTAFVSAKLLPQRPTKSSFNLFHFALPIIN